MNALSERTKDSRFLRHKLITGNSAMYNMYSQNIRVEGDGLAYNELNVLRALVLHPVMYVVMGTNMLLMYNQGKGWILFAHIVGFVFNLLRLVLSVLLLVADVVAWPVRFVFGSIASPVAFLLSAGHVYALSCSVIHHLLNGAGCTIVRTVTVANGRECEQSEFNAGGLGKVWCFKANSHADASYIAAKFKLRQRSGNGPECVWIRGIFVVVSRWTTLTLTNLRWGETSTAWKLMDLTSFEWRRVVINFEGTDVVSSRVSENGVQDESTLHFPLNDDDRHAHQQAKKLHHVGKWETVLSEEDLGTISELSELEEWYNSPLGWNKYHLMRADGSRIRIIRNDRRALSHIMAMVSSSLFYIQFRDRREGWLGLSIDLYALVLANYAFITGYAAEILVGRVNEVVEAKSGRYGVIVTRAIDCGYVRGFHVPNGDWLCYENGEKSLPRHEVTKTEVNATCNSFVKTSYTGERIVIVTYLADSEIDSVNELAWVHSSDSEIEQNCTRNSRASLGGQRIVSKNVSLTGSALQLSENGIT